MIRILTALLAICLLAPLFAQSTLEIAVVDSMNKPLADQSVEVANAAIGLRSLHVSNAQGKILVSGLSTSGSYSVRLQGSFFQADPVDGVVLIPGKTTSVTLVLRPLTTGLKEVEVSARTYQTINTRDAEVASELSIREIQALPVEGRDITRVLYRLPNITQATGFFPEAPNVSVNGANPLYVNYQIDGLDNNENFLGGQRFAMPVGFTQNITALTNNFGAEHGLTSNGIINITTRSGSNTSEGEVFYLTRPGGGIDAASPFPQRDLSGNQVKEGFQRQQGGFGLGGAIVKDRTFYYINAEHTTDFKDNVLTSPALGVNTTVPGTNRFTYLSGKIDHTWSNRFRSSLRVNGGIVNIERQGGGLTGGIAFPSSGNKQDRNSLNIALKNIYHSDRVVYESNFLYGRFRWNYADAVDPSSPDVTVQDPGGNAVAFLGHPGYLFDEHEATGVVQQKFALYRDKHTVKFGAELKSSDFQLFGGGNPNGSYLVQLNDAQLQQVVASGVGSALSPTDIPADVNVLNYSVELRPTSFGARQNIISLYAEDQVSVSARLNMNVGVRYDYDNLSKGGSAQGDMNNIAPRISANYKLDERSSLRVGYGMYYDKVLYAIYSDALQSNTTGEDYQRQLQALVDGGLLPAGTNIADLIHEGNLTASASGVPYLQGPSSQELQGQRGGIFRNELRVLNPNGYDNPYSHQMMIGYQRKAGPKTMFYVDALHNRSYNLFRLRNLNAPAAFPIDPDNVVVRDPADADLSRPVPIYTDGGGSYALVNGDTLRGVARNVVMTESAGRSNYYALNFTLQKERGDDIYDLRLMYTLSYLENNTEDINFRAMDSNDFEAEWGPSINDRTHLINVISSLYATKHLTFTLAMLMQSGQPINRIPDGSLYGTTDLNGDGQGFGDAYVGNSDRSPGEARNNDRLPWSNTLDINTVYRIPAGKGGAFELSATVFNVFNAVNLSGYANNATQSNQVQPGPASSGVLIRRNAAPPRQFQFGVRYTF